jgi:radical SAM superfamily enzyme YgiQ (UPF0313 family)
MTGGLSYNFHVLKNIFDKVHFNFPSIINIRGGGIVTGDPKVTMEAFDGKVDIGVIGEGEATIVEVATALENGDDLSLVKGIIFKQSNGGGGGGNNFT